MVLLDFQGMFIYIYIIYIIYIYTYIIYIPTLETACCCCPFLLRLAWGTKKGQTNARRGPRHGVKLQKTRVFLRCKMDENGVPSLKINMEPFWIHPWKRRFLLETIIFRFYVKLRGCTLPETNISKIFEPENGWCRRQRLFPSFWGNLGLFSVALNEKLLGFYFRDEKAKGPTVDIQSYCWWFRNPAHILHHLTYV